MKRSTRAGPQSTPRAISICSTCRAALRRGPFFMALRGPCSGGRSSTSVTPRSGDAFTFRRKTARVILPALNAVSFSLADELNRRSQRLPSARKRPEFNNGLDSSGRKAKTADGLNKSGVGLGGRKGGRAESKAETSNGLNKVGEQEGELSGRRV